MKLKTKFEDEDFKMGEVVEAQIYHGRSGSIKLEAEPKNGGHHTFYYESLKGLNEEWEDYVEPKEYWTIDWTCTGVTTNKYSGDDVDDFNKSIGNYFETKEEAELAVRKLKALKRLKDKGFRFTITPASGSLDITPDKFQIEINADMPAKWFCCDAVHEDLDLLFGGEE